MSILDNIKKVFTGTPKARKNEARAIDFSTAFGSGVSVTPETALTFTAVWSAIRLLSESVSSLPISVFKKETNGDTIEAINDPSYSLLKFKPNSYQNKITFFEKIMMDLCVNGNSYVYIERNRLAKPTGLYCLNYEDVTIKNQDNLLYYEDKKKRTIHESDNILHFTGLTTDGVTGLSPITQNMKSIGWSQAIEEYGNTFFKNGAKLSGVLQTDRALSETAIDRLRSSFNNTYSKLTGANQTAILEE